MTPCAPLQNSRGALHSARSATHRTSGRRTEPHVYMWNLLNIVMERLDRHTMADNDRVDNARTAVLTGTDVNNEGEKRAEKPESVQKKHNAFGAKVFYYRALFQGAYFDEDASTPKLENGLVDYAWVAADELDDYFESDHAEYMRQVL